MSLEVYAFRSLKCKSPKHKFLNIWYLSVYGCCVRDCSENPFIFFFKK